MEYLTEWPPQEQVDDSGSVKEKSLAETKSSFGENNLKRSWSKFNEQSMHMWFILIFNRA